MSEFVDVMFLDKEKAVRRGNEEDLKEPGGMKRGRKRERRVDGRGKEQLSSEAHLSLLRWFLAPGWPWHRYTRLTLRPAVI